MPGKCRFQDIWLDEPSRSLWLRMGKDIYTAFCSLCKKSVDISHSGVNALKSHESGKKHKTSEYNLKSGKQVTLHSFKVITKPSHVGLSVPSNSECRPNLPSVGLGLGLVFGDDNQQPCTSKDIVPIVSPNVDVCPPPRISSYLLSDSVTKAEILWAAYCVSSHTSTRSGGEAVNLFPQMFPDSQIAQKLQMQKDKLAYSVTYGLGPYFSNLTKSNVRKSPIYALSIDECLNDISQKQQLDVMVNYWDMDKNCVRTSYLTSAFLEKSAAVNLLESVLNVINDANLSLESLIQLSTDGPNVNLKLIFDINQHMKDHLVSEQTILDVGTCSLHIVNGAYKTAHAKVNWKLNQFLRSLYRLFKNYPSRRSLYKQITGSSIFPKKFCAVRWTENSSVIQRCLEMIPHLKKYVSEVQKNAPDSQNFQTVKNVLKEDTTLEAKLHFSYMIANELEEFLTVFQRNDPLLPFLHQEVFLLMKSLGSRFIKKSVMDDVVSAAKLKRIDLDLESNLKSVETVDIGFGARASLKNVKEIDVQRFRLDCKKFLRDMFKKLIEKSPLNKKVVLGATCLNPNIMTNDKLRESRIKVAVEEFVSHNQLTPSQGDLVHRSYIKFCENNNIKKKLNNFNWKKDRLDILFSEMFSILKEEEINNTLQIFIKKILVCFHGNAAVERSFSFNKNFLVENLEEKSLIAQRHLHDHTNSLAEGIASLDVTKKMIVEFRNASARRRDDLQAKRKAEDETLQAKKKASLQIKELQKQKQKLLEEKQEELTEIEKKLKFLKQNQ